MSVVNRREGTTIIAARYIDTATLIGRYDIHDMRRV